MISLSDRIAGAPSAGVWMDLPDGSISLANRVNANPTARRRRRPALPFVNLREVDTFRPTL